MNTFGQNLRAAREAKGLTQAEVGGSMSSPPYRADLIDAWESNVVRPSIYELQTVCQILDTTPNALFGWPEPTWAESIVADYKARITELEAVLTAIIESPTAPELLWDTIDAARKTLEKGKS